MSLFDGRVRKDNAGLFTVEAADGALLCCRAATRLRNGGQGVKPGDLVRGEDNGDGTGFITAVLPRRNDFIRPSVCNIDLLVIAVSASTPATPLYNIDKQTALAALNGADCCIAVTKHDTETDGAQTELLQRVYTQAGCEVVVTSAATGEGVDALRRRLEGCVSAFSGASGVGKSSLMNALYPAFSAQVGEISGRIARGRNTTRLTELFKAGPSTYVADTPGFTMLDLVRYDIIPLERIHDAFPDLRPYMDRCRYRKWHPHRRGRLRRRRRGGAGVGVRRTVGELLPDVWRAEGKKTLLRERVSIRVYWVLQHSQPRHPARTGLVRARLLQRDERQHQDGRGYVSAGRSLRYVRRQNRAEYENALGAREAVRRAD